MSQTLTQHDLEYLKLVKEVLNSMPNEVLYEEGKFYWDIYDPQKDSSIKDKMIQSFIEDLIQDNKTYSYYMYFDSYSYQEQMNLLFAPLYENNISDWVKIRMNYLIDNEGELFLDLLDYAKDEKNLFLFLNVLKKGFSYGQLDHFSDSRILARVMTYCVNFVNLFYDNKESIINSFIEHLDKSLIVMDDSEMINLYHKVFGQECLSKFLNHFQLGEVDKLFLETQEKVLSTVKIGRKALATTHLTQGIFVVMNSALIQSQSHFPKFFVLNDDDSPFITLAIETIEPQAEDKVKMLIKQLIESNYLWREDKLNGNSKLIELAKQINEKINLEHLIEKPNIHPVKMKI
jgi:hypothetical protein